MFNQDSLYRWHEKREKDIKFQNEEYEWQKAQLGEEAFYDDGKNNMITGFEANDEWKKRLMDAIQKQQDKKDKFSRRRMHVEDEDVLHVNERNKHFNKKMDRHYGDHVLEIRQNLERGTAL